MWGYNKPARFRLFSSSERAGDRMGDLCPVEGLAELPPIFTVLRLEGTSRDQVLVFAQDMRTGKGRPGARVLVADGDKGLETS